jgi:hypothetical protein
MNRQPHRRECDHVRSICPAWHRFPTFVTAEQGTAELPAVNGEQPVTGVWSDVVMLRPGWAPGLLR